MLKLVVLLIAALAAPCIAQNSLTFIFGDPQVLSIKRPNIERCSYSSPAWLNSFYHPRIRIESTFYDLVAGSQISTVQTSLRITFSRPGFASQIYDAANPALAVPSTFFSGASSVSGWLLIQAIAPNTAYITDYTTGSVFIITNFGGFYTIYLTAPTAFFNQASGILVQGCSYHSIFPWLPYGANPNLGRRKRQADFSKPVLTQAQIQACNDVSKKYIDSLTAAKFDNQKSLTFETVSGLCQSEYNINADAPKFLQQNLEALLKGIELGKKNLGSTVPEVLQG